ncbi:MarR family transcriptional regulator [Microterricola viridarii]|uniref:DNA-binding transcriptional regulator, MarR family n=1 Tax=Microterricola viridarii TaxID=412690 RepID=A0A1H1LUQ9_9MICO|nr:MarR family transcriptional regulator [Microterricola viridarii]SDR78251.1 DNA-binding transcriptional regulator, MarR family [Microterricola viridarii]
MADTPGAAGRPPAPLDAEEQLIALWLQARHTAAAMEAALDARLQRELGVPLARYALLCTLDDPDCALNQQVIAALLGMNKSSVSRHVDAAAQAGLVAAAVSAESRRDKTVRLTESGRSLLERGRAIVAGYAPQLPQQQLDQAIATLAHFTPPAAA